MAARKTTSDIIKLSTRAGFIFLFVLFGYFLADLGTLWSRRFMLPTQPPPARPKKVARPTGSSNYESVIARNMFNSDGVIPEPLIAKQGPKDRKELPPIPSQLPLTLMGTLVHSVPEKSLAAIELKGKNQILSFRPGMEIEKLATLEKVERMKAFIRNLNTGRMEFIEMKSNSKMLLKTTAAPATTQTGDVKKVSESEFEIKRSDLLKHTQDLSALLMQARVVPARRGGGGDIYGFRLVEMQPGSIYSQLGLQIMDVITGVNGTPVTNAQQAMELYTALKNSDNIKINIERNGANQSLDYRVTK